MKFRGMKHLFVLLLLIVTVNPVVAQDLDIDMLKAIHVHRDKNLDPGFKFVTHTVTPVSIAAPVTVLTIALIKKDSTLAYKGLFMAESLLVTSFISTALKYSVRRDRPFESYDFIDPQVHAAERRSFPSGHTGHAFAAATSLSIAFPKWYVIAPAYLWAGAVGYSRMHLGVHYPSDVLAGAVIGSGTTLLAHVLNKKLLGKARGQKQVNLYINPW